MNRQGAQAWTVHERERGQTIREIGCLACHLEGLGFQPTQIHHLTVTGRHGGPRRGHHATVGLCAWHHQGYRTDGASSAEMRAQRGPSLALEPRAFREKYGEDPELLQAQDLAIATALGQRVDLPF